MSKFCRPLERHYMTKAAANAAKALNMAKEIATVCRWTRVDRPPIVAQAGIQDLVEIINDTARRLIQRCEEASYEIDAATRKD